MTKLVMYRNNSAYEQFLAPALVDREGFEVQVFEQGTSETEITTWLTKHADRIRSMKNVYLDKTCYKAGKNLPSVTKNWGHIWMDVQNNFGGLDEDFRRAAYALMTKATVEETIAEIVRHMLVREVPTKVFLIQDHMGDHDLFGLGHHSDDWKEEAQRDAEKLHLCLEKITGQSVSYPNVSIFGFDAGVPLTDKDTVWVFLDRHFKSSKELRWKKIPADFRQFQMPIENLVEDAIAFGIDLETEAYSRLIREVVAAW